MLWEAQRHIKPIASINTMSILKLTIPHPEVFQAAKVLFKKGLALERQCYFEVALFIRTSSLLLSEKVKKFFHRFSSVTYFTF